MNKDVWQIFNTRSKYQKNTDSINKSEKYRIPHPLVESYFSFQTPRSSKHSILGKTIFESISP